LDGSSPKIAPDQVQNLNPNNNNIKHYQYNNNKEIVAVDFIKLKEEERRKEDYRLDFKELMSKAKEKEVKAMKEKKYYLNLGKNLPVICIYFLYSSPNCPIIIFSSLGTLKINTIMVNNASKAKTRLAVNKARPITHINIAVYMGCRITL
jgi:hypothetical protein